MADSSSRWPTARLPTPATATISTPWRRAARSTSSHRRARATMLTAKAHERQLAGRTGVYDVEVVNQRGESVALFRGKSYRIKGHLIEDLGDAMPVKRRDSRRARTHRDRELAPTRRAAARPAEMVARARLRSRASLSAEVRRRPRPSAGPQVTRRPREISVHDQGGPARQLSVRNVRRAARADLAHSRVVGYDRQADGRRLHGQGHRHVGRP